MCSVHIKYNVLCQAILVMRYLLAFQMFSLFLQILIRFDQYSWLDFGVDTRHLYRKLGNQEGGLLTKAPLRLLALFEQPQKLIGFLQSFRFLPELCKKLVASEKRGHLFQYLPDIDDRHRLEQEVDDRKNVESEFQVVLQHGLPKYLLEQLLQIHQ
ncbi:unannotated protein [freshwater metagenome]|uniref:Unannotated protein n=1 Tax=freshwater metagenome TaxID=449393 RepID=A0A6J6R1H5_9ZZZZ